MHVRKNYGCTFTRWPKFKLIYRVRHYVANRYQFLKKKNKQLCNFLKYLHAIVYIYFYIYIYLIMQQLFRLFIHKIIYCIYFCLQIIFQNNRKLFINNFVWFWKIICNKNEYALNLKWPTCHHLLHRGIRGIFHSLRMRGSEPLPCAGSVWRTHTSFQNPK